LAYQIIENKREDQLLLTVIHDLDNTIFTDQFTKSIDLLLNLCVN